MLQDPATNLSYLQTHDLGHHSDMFNIYSKNGFVEACVFFKMRSLFSQQQQVNDEHL